jgi:anti-sigma factor RsiW
MQHLDEGTIHAWLDGELSPAERAEVEAHIAACAACAAAVAEARGFVAASSRILTALDSVPGGVLPASSAVPRARPAHRRFMASRAWMAVAAVLVLSTVTVLATRPNGDSAQLQVAAAAREQKEQPAASPAPAEEHVQAMKRSAGSPAADSGGVGAARAGGTAVAGNAPAATQSRVAAPASAKPVDQTERLKSRLEAERKSTLVRPSYGEPGAARNAVKDMAEKPEDSTSVYESLSGKAPATSGPSVTITGRVTSEAGAPLASASVALEGMHVATTTRDDGTYELLLPAGRATGRTASLVARLIGYKSSAAPVALTSSPITQDFVLSSNPLALGQVVLSGEGAPSAARKPRAVTGTDESPSVVSRDTSTQSGDSVVTTIYAVSNGTVTLIERSSGADETRRQRQSANFSDQVMSKARDDARINSITWSDSSGHMRTLRGAVSREALERIRTALFGPKP